MFFTAKLELASSGYILEDIAPLMGLNTQDLKDKLNGFTEFTLTEAKKFKQLINSDLSLEELFEVF